MTDKWLSELMGGDSQGRRGHGEAQHSPTAETQHRYNDGAEKIAEIGKCFK